MTADPNARTRVTTTKPDPLVGRVAAGYRIDEVVGRGGMGAVYRATQLSLGRSVAMKVLTEDLARDPQFKERFAREADALSRLSHPNIVTVFDRTEVEGLPCLVMELVEGASLREVLRKGPLPPSEALRILSSVLSALEHAHRNGVVHRDIKPENVLLARGTIAKVADFGLSRLLGPGESTRLTRTHLLLGTYEYMAPEQRERSREADERSDLYAAGVVLYEMLTGELPIGRFEMPSQRRPGECDRRIDALVERSLEKDPARRFQRAEEMSGAVSAILDRPEPEAARAESRPLRYHPTKLEWHVDNVATVDYVLGTIALVVGIGGVVSRAVRDAVWTGFPFWGLILLGFYLQRTAANLRAFSPAARTGQALVAILCIPTGVLVPFTLYSVWVLFSHRGRTYYEARGRGLDEGAAARYAHRIVEEPFRSAPPPPPPAPPRPPMNPPRPSDIPARSVLVSKIRMRHRSRGFLLFLLLLILALAFLLSNR